MFFFFVIPFCSSSCFFFFFNDTATTEIYTLSLHDALPISSRPHQHPPDRHAQVPRAGPRSEEHTSELQSRRDLVCRLLLEKKKKQTYNEMHTYEKSQRSSSQTCPTQ